MILIFKVDYMFFKYGSYGWKMMEWNGMEFGDI